MDPFYAEEEKEKMNVTSDTVVYRPCSRGHSVLWAGDPAHEIPEGVECECGKTVVHYKTCKECEHRWMEFVDK